MDEDVSVEAMAKGLIESHGLTKALVVARREVDVPARISGEEQHVYWKEGEAELETYPPIPPVVSHAAPRRIHKLIQGVVGLAILATVIWMIQTEHFFIAVAVMIPAAVVAVIARIVNGKDIWE